MNNLNQSALEAIKELKKFKNTKNIERISHFYRTGKGEYGEGDVFYGVKVPDTRKLAKLFCHLSLKECEKLLKSKIHEVRFLGLVIMGLQFKKAKEEGQAKIFKIYIKNIKAINNWDLVDSSAHNIVGGYLYNKDRELLLKYANSKDLWKKRISIIATFYFIRKRDFTDTLKISKILLYDDHDLIHKAVGWMLREVGNRDFKTEESFLLQHYQVMPRTMLRYSIEKFPEKIRLKYLKKD